MKKFMALALVAMMVLASTAVFAAEEPAATEEVEVIEVTEEVVEVTEEVTEEVIVEETEVVVEGEVELDPTIIMLQINNKIMFVNDDQIELDVPAQLINSRTMVPMRAIFEALSATVEWDNDTETATAERAGVVIKITINSNTMYVGEETVELDVPAQLVDDRTLVPVRAISEAFGCAVTWDEATETVIIKADAVVVEETVVEETVIEETVVEETVIEETTIDEETGEEVTETTVITEETTTTETITEETVVEEAEE